VHIDVHKFAFRKKAEELLVMGATFGDPLLLLP